MRRPIFLIFTNAMILLVIFALLTQSLVIVQRLAIAQVVTGRVEVQRSGRGNFRTLAAQNWVKSGDVIRTGPRSNAEFVWADGTRWKLMSDTQLTVKKSVSNTLERAEQSQLKLDNGKVFVRIVKRLSPSSGFEVQTPTATARVRGTIFSVQVENGQTRVQVLYGQVEVDQNDAAQTADNTGTSHADVLIVPGECAISGAQLQRETDANAAAEFAAEPSIAQPSLHAKLQVEDNQWLVSGDTESGNSLAINGQKVRVLGNGVFLYRFNRPAKQFTVVSTDRHGISSTQILTSNSAR